MTNKNHASIAREYLFEGFRLDIAGHCLYGPDGKAIQLSSRALDTLQILIEHRGEALSKSFLLETVWPDNIVEENNLNQAITSIRKVLGDSKNDSRFIKTLTGKGYCFIAELETQPPRIAPALADLEGALSPSEHQPAVKEADTARTWLPNNYALAIVLLLCFFGAGLYLYKSESTPSNSSNTTISSADLPTDISEPGSTAALAGSIAVMPFANLSPESISRTDIFSLGLHDELINQLSQMDTLKLVSRESVLSPSIRQLTLKEVGRILHVESIITGSILVNDEQARIKIQMLDPETGVIKWAFDHNIDTSSLNDMINAQRGIALKVTQALQSENGHISPQLVFASPTTSFEAYRFNMAARRAFYNQDFESSLNLSKQALSMDPDYPGALFNYSRANYYMSSNPMAGMTSKNHIQESLEAAQQLIKLAPDKHEGYVLKAMALASSGLLKEAMTEVKRLEKMEAPLWDLQLIAPLLMSLGEYQSTINILEANLQIEPLNSFGRGFLMAAYEAVGNSFQARLEYEIGEELTPDWWGDTVNIFLTLGRGELSTDINNLNSEELRTLLSTYLEGDRSTILSLLDSALLKESSISSLYVHYAAIAAMMGEHDKAIQFMIRATNILPVHIHWIWQPAFRETWKHPKFESLLESAGVLSYWQEYGQPEICQSAVNYFICDNKLVL